MKKYIAWIVAAFLLFAGGCAKPHVHIYSEEWKYDETGHWHEPLCEDTEEQKDRASHTFSEGKCSVCGYPEPKPVYATSSDLSQKTSPATQEERSRAEVLLGGLSNSAEGSCFLQGSLYVKMHASQGTAAEDREVTVEGFSGLDLSDADGLKVALTEFVPSNGRIEKRYYYADGECAAEIFGYEKNYYEAAGTVAYLLEDLYTEIGAEIEYAQSLFGWGADTGYSLGGFETVSVERRTASDSAKYVFLFYKDALAGLRAQRLSGSGTLQIDLLIGDAAVEKPDVTAGFTACAHRPKWAAGYPTEEIFGRKYEPVSGKDLSDVRALLRNAASKVNGRDTSVLADGDIRFVYEADGSFIDVTYELGATMKVAEKSRILPGTDEEIDVEHYADVSMCYEVMGGETVVYLGNYAENFYRMIPAMLVNMCEYIGMYFSSGGSDTFKPLLCDSEFSAVELSVEGEAEFYYIFDQNGNLLAARVDMGDAVATIMTGKFNVTIPAFGEVTLKEGAPDIDYLNAGSNQTFGYDDQEFDTGGML